MALHSQTRHPARGLFERNVTTGLRGHYLSVLENLGSMFPSLCFGPNICPHNVLIVRKISQYDGFGTVTAILLNRRRQRKIHTAGGRDRSADDVRSRLVIPKFLHISIGDSKQARLIKPTTDSTQFADSRNVAWLPERSFCILLSIVWFIKNPCFFCFRSTTGNQDALRVYARSQPARIMKLIEVVLSIHPM
ncbi:hypothetical protein BO85DRAFT_447748 [Aspergillus piperis CBS 112811]|uniref:Uncharacterized protein n=1 Tax=Aspergillus piperis CBS 112811 TaxID=1448313 RepID=A0A8G1R742_9EURO|nr:hypothetical protein BO85DRAFT_447748 [Aspergillus piperis CBS 112811]RAH59881.1 hypothetical protein BO85DRAFT_447748 [Aspergillus piperis CBS 112811]